MSNELIYISQLVAASTVSSTDLVPVTQGSTGPGTGVTRKMTLGQINSEAIPTGYVTATGSTEGRNLPDRFADVINVRDFGAKGDGAADDTAAIQAAENAIPSGSVLFFPPGVYMVNSTGISKKSGVSWRGPGGTGATLRAITGPTWSGDIVNGVSGASNFDITGLCFDWNNAAASGVASCLHTVLGSNVKVEKCTFLHIWIFGLILDGTTDFHVSGNYFQKDTPVNTQNQSILISPASGIPGPGTVDKNISINTAFDFAGAFLTITENYISGWKYGSGITIGPDPNTNFSLVANNICVSGRGTDVNNTVCTGIENWSPFSTLNGNICYDNDGDGLDNNALNCVVTGNLCMNNGQLTSYASAGIGSGYLNSMQCGNYSVISGNVCIDTQGSKTQKYGYADRVSTLTDISVHGNLCFGNATGPVHIQGARCDFRGPKVWGSAAFTGGAITSLDAISVTATVGGATVGDICTASLNQDLQGCIVNAWCAVPGQVIVALQNINGTTVTLASGTINVCAEKHPNYIDF